MFCVCSGLIASLKDHLDSSESLEYYIPSVPGVMVYRKSIQAQTETLACLRKIPERKSF